MWHDGHTLLVEYVPLYMMLGISLQGQFQDKIDPVAVINDTLCTPAGLSPDLGQAILDGPTVTWSLHHLFWDDVST